MSEPPVAFKDLLRRLLPDKKHHVAPFRTQRELAGALGVEPNTVSRILHSDDVLDIIGCLRLAKVGNYPYNLVFTLAAKPEVAELITHVASGSRGSTSEERELLALWPRLPAIVRAVLVRGIAEYISLTQTDRDPPRRKSRRQ